MNFPKESQLLDSLFQDSMKFLKIFSTRNQAENWNHYLNLVYNPELKIEAITFVIFSLQLYTLCPKLWNLCSHLYLSWDKFLSGIYCSLKICISNKRKLTQRTSTSTLCSCSKVFDSVCLTCWNIYFGKLLVFNIYHTLGFEISIEFNLQMF